jgi:cell division protein FtsQ
LTWGILAAGVIFLFGSVFAAIYHYGEHSWRFRIESSDNIEIAGLHNVTRQQVMEVMGGDIGRNIFFVPLTQRQAQLEQIPWVESASVMRFVPNRLRIEIHERTPVAFVRVGSRISLIDAGGTLMDLPAAGKKKYSFPVILGMNLGEPHSIREARMKTYNQLVDELDSGGAHYSQGLSEVDLSDADDVKVMTNDPGGEVLVHLGSSNFLDRYKIYVTHVREWRQQFDKLDSVDLRYDNQIVVNPDLRGAVREAPLPVLAAKAAASAGVKPAALISKESAIKTTFGPQPVHAAVSAKPVTTRTRANKTRRHKPALQRTKTQAKPFATPVMAATKTVIPSAQNQAAKPTAVVPANPVNVTTKAGDKPSPAIPKGQDP